MQLKNCWARRQPRAFATAVFAVAILPAPASHAQISKANQILINRGLQVEGMVATYDTFHLSTYANYTAVNWLWDPPP